MFVKSASVASSKRYDEACAAGSHVKTGCSGVEFAPFAGESSVGAAAAAVEYVRSKSTDFVIAPDVPVTVTVYWPGVTLESLVSVKSAVPGGFTVGGLIVATVPLGLPLVVRSTGSAKPWITPTLSVASNSVPAQSSAPVC